MLRPGNISSWESNTSQIDGRDEIAKTDLAAVDLARVFLRDELSPTMSSLHEQDSLFHLLQQ